MTALLQFSNLLVRREGRTVLDIPALSIEKGDVLAIVGPNGAGKSTLFLVLASLLKADRGQILFNGTPMDSFSTLEYRRQIALVLQEPLLLDMSVYENVAIGLRFRRIPRDKVKERVERWLDRLDISHLSDRPARKLSGGEAQRVSLARAFVLQPDLLLLDEPFSALDAPTRTRLLRDLRSVLAEAEMTAIFITHDIQDALTLATRLAVLLEGRLEQSGIPQDVFERPTNARVADFLGK